MKRIIENYSGLMELFHEIEEESTGSDVNTKVAGKLAKMT